MISFTAEGANRDHFRNLVGRIGQAAAMPLTMGWDTVTIDEDFDPTAAVPPSPTLRARMQEMINSDLAVKLDIRQSLQYGSYGKTQRFNAAFLLDVENTAPGFGIISAVHEMWENYVARVNGADDTTPNWEPFFGAAHSSAVDVEDRVGSELTGRALTRVAALRAPNTYVFDYFAEYLVVTRRAGAGGGGPNSYEARTTGRAVLNTFQLAGGAVTGGVNKQAVDDTVTLLKQNPRATAGITGPNADRIRNALAVAFGLDLYLDANNPDAGLEKVHDMGLGADRGDLRSFVDPAPGPGVGQHGQIQVCTPA